MNNNEIENQQATQKEIGWLAGILDGEGTLVLTTQEKKTGTHHQPYIRITNTSEEILDKLAKILDKLSIKFHILKLNHDDTRMGTKDIYSVTVGRIEEVKKLLDILLDDLTEKRARGSLMLRYCDARIRNGYKLFDMEAKELAEDWNLNYKKR